MKIYNVKKGQHGNDLCTPQNLSKSKNLLDSFKATPKYLRSGLSQFFPRQVHIFVNHPNGHSESDGHSNDDCDEDSVNDSDVNVNWTSGAN